MPQETMRREQYQGPLWNGEAVHPNLWRLLLARNVLIEITTGAPPYRVVIGVPHHAAPGVEKIADQMVDERTGTAGRPADETAGLPALALFSALEQMGIPGKLVIAAHAEDHDPNKVLDSPYCRSIFANPGPALLFELHGAGPRREHDLELSAGSNEQANPEEFGRVLLHFLDENVTLSRQVRPGKRDGITTRNGQSINKRLEMPALHTDSLQQAAKLKIPALHLEMKFPFRQLDQRFPGSPRPSEAGWRLARALAQAIRLVTASDEVVIRANGLGLPSTAMLTRPKLEYEASYLDAARETPPHETRNNPELTVRTPGAFRALVEATRRVNFDGLPEHPPEEYLWLVDGGEYIGRAFFLHWLNDFRRTTDGQVDYWIRPSRRRQGYGRLLLRLLMERYRQLGLQRILISCLASNTPSQRIIEANGGVFDSEIQSQEPDGPQPRRRFWINLPPRQL